MPLQLHCGQIINHTDNVFTAESPSRRDKHHRLAMISVLIDIYYPAASNIVWGHQRAKYHLYHYSHSYVKKKLNP